MDQKSSSQNPNPNAVKSEDSTIFRIRSVEPVKETPPSPPEKREPAGPTIITPEFTEKPPSLVENHFCEMFDINEAKTHFEMPILLKEINDFVLGEMKRRNLDDTNKSYEEIINHYLDKLKLPDDIDQYTRTEKVHELMMIDAKLIKAMLEKEELLKKPIEELSSKQLRARIEGTL